MRFLSVTRVVVSCVECGSLMNQRASARKYLTIKVPVLTIQENQHWRTSRQWHPALWRILILHDILSRHRIFKKGGGLVRKPRSAVGKEACRTPDK